MLMADVGLLSIRPCSRYCYRELVSFPRYVFLPGCPAVNFHHLLLLGRVRSLNLACCEPFFEEIRFDFFWYAHAVIVSVAIDAYVLTICKQGLFLRARIRRLGTLIWATLHCTKKSCQPCTIEERDSWDNSTNGRLGWRRR